MARMSTALKNELLENGSLKATLAAGFIHIYGFSGKQVVPGPDEAVDTDTDYELLATIYSDGGTSNTGINLGTASNGVIQKASGETWDNSDGGNFVGGLAKFFVHVGSTETSGLNLVDPVAQSKPRIVGTIGTVGADMNLSDPQLVANIPQDITYYSATVGQ